MPTQTTQPYKGLAMEGLVARWYAGTTRKDMRRPRLIARELAARIPPISLLKSACTEGEMRTMVTQTPGKFCEIETDGIGFRLWLRPG